MKRWLLNRKTASALAVLPTSFHNEVLCPGFPYHARVRNAVVPRKKAGNPRYCGVSVTVPAGAVKTSSPPSEDAETVFVVEPTLTVQLPAFTPET